MADKMISPARERFVRLTDAGTGGVLLVRANQVVASVGREAGTELYLADGGIVTVEEPHGGTGLKFHNAVGSATVNGRPVKGQLSIRTGYLAAARERDGGVTLQLVDGHALDVEGDIQGVERLLESTEHEQATPHNWPSWA